MKPSAFGRAFALALIVSQLAVPVAVGAATTNAAVLSACAGLPSAPRIRAGCAAQLQTALKADAAAIKALKAGGAEAKAALVRLGLSEADLASAQIVVKQEGGEAARIKDVTVEISCCPLTIVITIRF